MQPPRRKIITRKRLLALAAQLILFAGMVWLVQAIAQNVVANLQERHIASGFGFLEQPAGFGISQTLIPYSESSSYGRAFLVGLLNTLLVAAVSVVLATILGLFVGIAR